MKPTFKEERKFWRSGIKFVLGIDEVGRGAFAGPIVAGAVVFPKILKVTRKHSALKKINDSKLLKAEVRRKLARKIKKHSLFYAVAEIKTPIINKLGIGRANKMVFRKVVSRVISQVEEELGRELKKEEYFLIADGFPTKHIKGVGLKSQKAIIGGDRKSTTIAAASILAKVHRDKLMRNLSKEFPQYRLARNKGYGTKKHQEALKVYGLSKIHRKSFNLSKFLTQSL